MPLKCTTKGGETHLAFNHNAASWQTLAVANRREKHLVMPCCGRPVVLKTSHLGTRFFAHARKHDSTCPTESEEHLLAKDLVARAALQAGWHAETEVSLQSRRLVADVLVTKGGRRIAFEIQWSRQKQVDTAKRHAAYTKAGVRALWLFKQAGYPRCKEVPAFQLVRCKESRAFYVWVWKEGHGYEKNSKSAQTIELQQFVSGALAGKLKWMPAVGLVVPVVGHTARRMCIRQHETLALTTLEVDVERLLPGHRNPLLSVESFGEYPELLRTAQARQLLERHGLTLHFGVSNTSGKRNDPHYQRYVLACCSECGDLIGQWELTNSETAAPSFELSLKLSEHLIEGIPALKSQLERWWFDCNLGNRP